MDVDVEASTVRVVAWRLLPLVFLLYFVSLIDRSNVAIAALAMNSEIGLDTYTYSLGVAAFFVGYIPFEIPSNAILARVGARRWIGRIAVSWGLVASLMAIVSGPKSFLAVRFLLGVAEAGLVPGILFYLAHWFPREYRARVNAAFLLAVPASGMVGAPLASSLLELQGWLGLSGWQWMFALEGVPSVVLGIAVFRFMTDRPADAAWLNPEQRRWLEARLDQEHSAVEAAHNLTGFWRGLTDIRVAWLCVVYFAFGTATYGMIYFMPLFIKNWGLSNLATGWTVAVPEAVGVVGMLAWGHWSDRTLERRLNLFVALLLAALGLAGMALYGGSEWSLAAAAMVVVGINAGRPLFWALPSMFLSRSAMASALALISCCANFGGMTGTVVIGWFKDATGGFGGGLLYVSALMAIAAVIVLCGFRSISPAPKPLAVV